MNTSTKSVLLSAFLVIGITLFENFISGNGLEWFESLEKPWYLVPTTFFFFVVFLYVIITLTVLYRLFTKYFKQGEKSTIYAILSIVLLMFTNAIWNYYFMGLENTKNGFYGMVFFLPVVLLSLFLVKREDEISFKLLFIYLLWVIYDIIWTYGLWQLNP